MNNIKIKEEAAQFLSLHSIGECSSDCIDRFTSPINFCEESKKALEQIYKHIGLNEKFEVSEEQFCLIQRAISKFRAKVSLAELELVNYIALVVHGNYDDELFRVLEKSYNQINSRMEQKAS